jgi:hypothetical protein
MRGNRGVPGRDEEPGKIAAATQAREGQDHVDYSQP